MKSVKLQASVKILNSPSKGKSNEQPQQQGKQPTQKQNATKQRKLTDVLIYYSQYLTNTLCLIRRFHDKRNISRRIPAL